MAQQGEVINHIYDGNEQASAELFDEAEMAHRRALSKAPEKPEALYNLGNTHFQEQDFDEAKQRFFQTQNLRRTNPANTMLSTTLAMCS